MRVGVDEPEHAPGQAVVHLVRALGDHVAFGVHHQADVAGGAGRRREVLADGPGHGLELPVLVVGREEVAVFARLVDLVHGDVGPDVALLARVRLARRLDREPVPGVAGGARAQGAVEVDAADPLVRPALDLRELELAGQVGVADLLARDLEFRPVAVVAALGLRGRVGGLDRAAPALALRAAEDGALEVVVERVVGEVLVGVRHDVLRILVGLLDVAGAAVARADHDVDVGPVVLERVGVLPGPQGVALGAADCGFRERARDGGARHLAPQPLHARASSGVTAECRLRCQSATIPGCTTR